MKKKLNIIIIIILFVTIAFTIILPFIVNGLFESDDEYLIMLDSSDMLEYSGNALSVIATAVLSCIAVAISNQSNDVSSRMLKLEEEKVIPYLDIQREESNIQACDNSTLKIKLSIRNIGEYPIQNILLSRTEPSKKEIYNLYVKGDIQNTIFEQLATINNDSEMNSVNYKLTCIAGLRERLIIHTKKNHGKTTEEKEFTDFSEFLYFNIDKKEIIAPIDIFITMQNIVGKVFIQKTKLFIIQRDRDKEYFLTMHSKKIENINI